MKNFNPNSSMEHRALQIYLILLGQAFERKTVTYRDLAGIMFYDVDPHQEQSRAGVMRSWLGCVAFWCEQEHLPPLTVIVVNSETGKPGFGFPERKKGVDELREEVYQFDWYNVIPPAPEDLLKAWRKAT